MNSKVYKWCGVPQCENTSIKTPDKLFVYVPHDKTIRNKWLTLARRDSKAILPSTHLYFCEDHFDLPNDMDNYMEYHLMGSVSQIRMKPGCMPTKFQCQPDRRKRTSDAIERFYILKKQRKSLIEECQKDLEEISTKQVELEDMSCGSSEDMETPSWNLHECSVRMWRCNRDHDHGPSQTHNCDKRALVLPKVECDTEDAVIFQGIGAKVAQPSEDIELVQFLEGGSVMKTETETDDIVSVKEELDIGPTVLQKRAPLYGTPPQRQARSDPRLSNGSKDSPSPALLTAAVLTADADHRTARPECRTRAGARG